MAEPLDNLLSSIEDVTQKIEALKTEKAQLEATLAESVACDVRSQLADKEYGCGTATIETTNSFKVRIVIAKKVEYDQSKLADLFDKIDQSGDDPFEYIKVKYDVSETAYKNWPSKIQAAFEPARTVEPSKPKITIERKEV
jgi:hypothetical protein